MPWSDLADHWPDLTDVLVEYDRVLWLNAGFVPTSILVGIVDRSGNNKTCVLVLLCTVQNPACGALSIFSRI